MWVARLAVPVRGAVDAHAADTFTGDAGAALREWSIHSPLWAPVRLAMDPLDPSNRVLSLRDSDPVMEHREVLSKGAALESALELAKEGL
jgi:hypothetical protein